MTQNASIGRLHYLLAITLLFTSGGHLLIVRASSTLLPGLPVGGVAADRRSWRRC